MSGGNRMGDVITNVIYLILKRNSLLMSSYGNVMCLAAERGAEGIVSRGESKRYYYIKIVLFSDVMCTGEPGYEGFSQHMYLGILITYNVSRE